MIRPQLDVAPVDCRYHRLLAGHDGGQGQVTDSIDPTFDFRTDTPTKKDGSLKDPDTFSPTLARYHQLLWSKPLPDGRILDLTVSPRPPFYLHHSSPAIGDFWLSSDSVIHTYSTWASTRDVLAQVDEASTNDFRREAYTIGGMMVFPANIVDGKPTINGERGFNHSIRERFDLTLECIRRHYTGAASPMGACLARYASFFALFGEFRGYVDFFLLQDLVTDDGSSVKFMTDDVPFEASPLPRPLDVYLEYRRRALEFVALRGRRMQTYAAAAQPA